VSHLSERHVDFLTFSPYFRRILSLPRRLPEPSYEDSSEVDSESAPVAAYSAVEDDAALTSSTANVMPPRLTTSKRMSELLEREKSNAAKVAKVVDDDAEEAEEVEVIDLVNSPEADDEEDVEEVEVIDLANSSEADDDVIFVEEVMARSR